MMNKNSYYNRQQNQNPQYPTNYPISLPSNNINIKVRQILNHSLIQNSEYFDQNNNQNQQIQPRSVSMNPNQKIKLIQEPKYTNTQQHQVRFGIQPKQEYQAEIFKQDQQFVPNFSTYNNQHRNNFQQKKMENYYQIQKNQPKILADQIEITLQDQRRQYKSLERQHQQKSEMLKYQQLNQSYDFNMPEINNKSNYNDIERQNTSQQSKINDSLNCSITSFMQTLRQICYYCKSPIDKKGINLSCWHQYHQECLTEIILSQIQKQSKMKLSHCLCGFKIKQQVIRNLQDGDQILKSLLEQQIGLIYFRYQKNLNKCPNCEFRFIKNYRLNNQCWCPNCEKIFKIQ